VASPRLGLYGGTFDPPHIGHLVAAERALQALGLDQVVFMPCGTPALKQDAGATRDQRLEMTRLAVAARPELTASDLELRRDGVSYTADTLEQLHEQRSEAEWWLILGADAVRDLPRWRRPERILELCRLAVLPRPGCDVDAILAALPATARAERVPMPLLDISSSALRADVAAGRSLRYLVPDNVCEFILKQRLYRNA
jgi:nicotinate-nucleotide adenylyltransferase